MAAPCERGPGPTLRHREPKAKPFADAESIYGVRSGAAFSVDHVGSCRALDNAGRQRWPSSGRRWDTTGGRSQTGTIRHRNRANVPRTSPSTP
mgnify:CR=1 FL=1